MAKKTTDKDKPRTGILPPPKFGPMPGDKKMVIKKKGKK